ncbi:HDIG domain protein [uncultured Desulfatiglans sp.]|uniref:HDIG domain protein n=1 Tax=Uncultured Desulfatiglans sp. TaxID=1748965 RepID=A0A653A121_UNCDX|nr:HDIG domain protein [uncultured Desulfatiglans sp.]
MEADLGQVPAPHAWLKDLGENERITGLYLVREKSLGTTRKGEPFLSLILADRTGEIEAKVWDQAEQLSALFQKGDVIEVEGDASSYRDRLQLRISRLNVPQEPFDRSLFVESSPYPRPEMMTGLRDVLRSVRDRHLSSLIDRVFADKPLIDAFKEAPAAKNMHHNYLGGLLEHTLSVCRLARAVAEHYPYLNRDLLLTGAFLHDIGKVRELSYDLQIDYTDEGRLLGHVVLGMAILDKKIGELKHFPQDLALRLRHLILSHHGQFEFGSPKRPKFLEGFALHLVDDLDAKMNGLHRFMERDRQEGAWTEFNRMFERFFLKGEAGLAGKLDETGKEEEAVLQGKLFAH